MASDTFIYWQEKTPSLEELAKVIEDYVGEGGEVTFNEVKIPIWFITLPGNQSFPFKRIIDKDIFSKPRERWIEIWYMDDKHIDVLTRQADAFTNAIAKGLVNLIVRYWEAKVDNP